MNITGRISKLPDSVGVSKSGAAWTTIEVEMAFGKKARCLLFNNYAFAAHTDLKIGQYVCVNGIKTERSEDDPKNLVKLKAHSFYTPKTVYKAPQGAVIGTEAEEALRDERKKKEEQGMVYCWTIKGGDDTQHEWRRKEECLFCNGSWYDPLEFAFDVLKDRKFCDLIRAKNWRQEIDINGRKKPLMDVVQIAIKESGLDIKWGWEL